MNLFRGEEVFFDNEVQVNQGQVKKTSFFKRLSDWFSRTFSAV
jgi:hypothetical protein